MNDVYGWAFRSRMGPDAALAALVPDVGGFTWAIRDSDYQGRYVNGSDRVGVRVRLLGEPITELELYLPGPAAGGPLPVADAEDVLVRRIPAVLGGIGAEDVRED